MLKDIITNFKDISDQNPSVILDNYTVKEGLYIRFDFNNGLENYEYMVIRRNEDILKDDKYKWFRDRDYYSSILNDDMNKAVDTKKQIHSTNEFSVFIKKNNFPGLDRESMVDSDYIQRIDQYLDSIKNLEDKYFDIYNKSCIKRQIKLDKKEFFEGFFKDQIQYLNSSTRIDKIEKVRTLLKNSLLDFIKIFKDIDIKENYTNYIKIFINEDLESYQKAYLLYIVPRIFNKNDYNAIIGGAIVGLPGSNITANDKKPYLTLKTMKTNVPSRVTFDEAMALKDLFLWFKAQNSNNISISYDYKYDMEPVKPVDGSYYEIHINKKELNIEDYDNLPFAPERMEFIIKNYLNVTDNDNITVLPSIGPLNRGELLRSISTSFFADKMKGYFKTEEPKVEAKTFTGNMQSLFLISRDAIYDFIVYGVERPFKGITDKITMESIKEQLLYTVEGIPKKMAHAYNLRLALLEYFDEGGKEMGDCIKNIIEELNRKVNTKQLVVCSCDEEFYFTAGQITYYILSMSQAKNKTYGMVEPFVHAKTSQDLKNKIKDIFNTYKYAININNFRFNNAYGMIMGYECTSKFIGRMQDIYYAGLMSNNIMYQKKDNDLEVGGNE